MQPETVKISVLELAKCSYPDGRTTSGADQDHMRKLDKVFRPSGYKALLYRRSWTPDLLITSLDESMSFNLTPAQAFQVIRK